MSGFAHSRPPLPQTVTRVFGCRSCRLANVVRYSCPTPRLQLCPAKRIRTKCERCIQTNRTGRASKNTSCCRICVFDHGFALKVRNRSWIGSVQRAVATWSVISMRHFLMIRGLLWVDEVATAPCTDPIQAWGPTFEAKCLTSQLVPLFCKKIVV